MLIDCPECNAKVSDTAASCPHCGAIPFDPASSLSVEVSDFDMKFSTAFWVFIKLSFAAVPAVIVVYTAWTVAGGLLSPLLNL